MKTYKYLQKNIKAYLFQQNIKVIVRSIDGNEKTDINLTTLMKTSSVGAIFVLNANS